MYHANTDDYLTNKQNILIYGIYNNYCTYNHADYAFDKNDQNISGSGNVKLLILSSAPTTLYQPICA